MKIIHIDRSKFSSDIVANLDRISLISMTMILIIVVARLNPAWFNLATLQTSISQNAPLYIIAIAMTFSIISGNIDLSPGSMIALTGVIVGLVFERIGNLALSFCAGAAFAIFVGLVHATMVAKLRINAVIVTLAAYVWARGMAIGLTNANPININTSFINMMNTFAVGGITIPIVLVIAAYVCGWFLLNRTKMGRYTFAMGADPRATERAGISLLHQDVLIFGFMGLMIAVATVVTISQVAGAQPLAQQGLELDAIIAVIIGGSKLTGGEGSILQTLLGVIFVTALDEGLGNLGLSDAGQLLIKGLVILFVLSVQTIIQRMTGRQSASWRVARAGTKTVEAVSTQ
jgi:ribose transport system permease protein